MGEITTLEAIAKIQGRLQAAQEIGKDKVLLPMAEMKLIVDLTEAALRGIDRRDSELTILRPLAAAAAAFCDEVIGEEENSANGTRLNELVRAWRGQGVSTGEPEPPEYQRTNDEEC